MRKCLQYIPAYIRGAYHNDRLEARKLDSLKSVIAGLNALNPELRCPARGEQSPVQGVLQNVQELTL